MEKNMDFISVAKDKMNALDEKKAFSLNELFEGDPDWEACPETHRGKGKEFYYRCERGEFDTDDYRVKPIRGKNPQRYWKVSGADAHSPVVINGLPNNSTLTVVEANIMLASLGKTLAIVDIP
jgi:hypothetical protein